MDWKATLEEILAERRQQLGEAPSFDDLIALRAGELSDDDRRRLLEQAAVDPEVARELFDVLRFPRLSGDEDPTPDEDGVGERWQALRDRLVAEGDLPDAAPAVAARGRPAWWALAAMFLLGLAAALVVGRWRESGASGPAVEARINLPIVELLPVGDDDAGLRGSVEVATVAADAGGLVLTLAVPDLVPSPDRGAYVLEITRGDGTTTTLAGLVPGIGGVFVLDVPREDLTDGVHDLRLRDADRQQVARFHLEVELRQ